MRRDHHLDLTSAPVPYALRTIAIPATVGIIFNTMYNVVDTFWAGQSSTDSLAALSLNFPIYLLAMTIGVGFSAGVSALVSNYIGSRQEDEARIIFLQGISFAAIIQLLLTIPLLFLLKPIFTLMHAEASVMPGALRYGSVIVGGSILMTMSMVINSALTARGMTKPNRNILIIGFLLNLGLDPLFLYGVRIGEVVIIPELQEAGIAAATILIQGITALYLLRVVVKSGILKGASRSELKPDPARGREIISQVIPAMMNFMIMATGTFVITFYISRYGTAVVAAYGSAIRIEQIALVPNMGLNTALMAMVGQNNGANRPDRVRESFSTALWYGFGIMVILLSPVLLFGRHLLTLFTDSAEVITIGYTYLLIQGITHFSYIIMSQSNSVLQGIKRPAMIMWIGFYRQVAAPAVVFTLLAVIIGMEENGVWWGLVIVNWSAAIFSLYWTRRKMRQVLPVSMVG